MRIQTALLNETLDFSVFASVRNFTFLSRVLCVERKGRVAPALPPPRGARYKSTPKTQVFKTSREPLARFPSMRTRPVSPGRRVQSFNLSPSARGVKGWAAVTFRLSLARPFLQRLQSTRLPSCGQGRFFPNSFPLPRPAAVSGDSPTRYQPLQPPSTPADVCGVALTSLARTRREPRLGRAPEDTEPPRVLLAGVPVGVGDGVRTRDLRNHNPAL